MYVFISYTVRVPQTARCSMYMYPSTSSSTNSTETESEFKIHASSRGQVMASNTLSCYRHQLSIILGGMPSRVTAICHIWSWFFQHNRTASIGVIRTSRNVEIREIFVQEKIIYMNVFIQNYRYIIIMNKMSISIIMY